MSSNFVRTFCSRVPLIKFRKGTMPEHVTSSAAPIPFQSPRKGKINTVNGAIIEDWQLPLRFKRRPISEEECEAINLGGAI